MVHPNDLVLGGWDISKANLGEAMERAQVLDYDLQRQISDTMKTFEPLPSIYYPDFIAANQNERADNLLPGSSKAEHLNAIRQHIRQFKEHNNLEKVVLIWSANTVRVFSPLNGHQKI
jgi:myo-inositol-1-phosphate synthase